MTRILVTVFFLLLFFLETFSQVNLDSGLIAFYPFNGNAQNAAGSSGHGTIMGAYFIPDRFDKSNSAISFYYYNMVYIQLKESGINLPWGNSPRTLCAWVKINEKVYDNPLICYGADETAKVCRLCVTHGRPRFHCGYNGFEVYGHSMVADNKWHFIAVVYNGSHGIIYTDGRWDNEFLMGEGIDSLETTPHPQGIWYIGRDFWGGGDDYQGAADDIRIYNRALTEEEIIALYDCKADATTKIFDDLTDMKLSSSLEQDIQKIIDDDIEQVGLIGATAAIITQDLKLEFAGGMSNPVANETMAPDMLFRVCEMLQSMMAALTLELVNEGKLSLDDPLSKWLPSYPNIDSNITIRQLLNMTSGVADYISCDADKWTNTILNNPNKLYTPEESILTFVGLPDFSPPGSQISYSRTNYLLLGMIVKKVIDTSISAELRRRFLDPLELSNTYFAIEESVPENIAHEWTNWNNQKVDISLMPSTAVNSMLWTSGALYSNTKDLVKWTKAFWGGEVINDTALMQHIITRDPYERFGSNRALLLKRELYGHGGATPVGYRSNFLFSTKDNLSVAVLGNYFPLGTGNILEKMMYAALVHKNQLPVPRIEPKEINFGIISTTAFKADTCFYIYNDGPASDNITLSVNYDKLNQAELQVEPLMFTIPPGSSQKVTISTDQLQVQEGVHFRPKITVHSNNNLILPEVITERLYYSSAPTVGVNEFFQIPAKLELHQNYPNPFNSATKISFDVPKASEVELCIYDVLGRQVYTFNRSVYSAGTYEVIWEGNNDAGNSLSSGIYFIRMKTPQKLLTCKTLLLK